MKDKRTVLVTGGAGFIGSHLVRRLLKGGYDVAVLTKDTTKFERIADVAPHITIIRDDLSDATRLKKLLEPLQVYGVFHCASSNIKQGAAAPEDDLVNVNVKGFIHLVQALADTDYEFFINSGSYLEYGTHETPFLEDDLCRPVEIYALTKLVATLYGQAVARSAGKPIVTLRIYSPYGPEMEEGRLVEAVVRHAIRNEEIKLTSPETSRDFIFIDDLTDLYVEAAEKAAAHAGEIFNAAGGKALTLKELVEKTIHLTSSKSTVVWGGAKAVSYDKGCQEASMTKTFTAFAWRPKVDIVAGLGRMAEWLGT